MIRDLIHEDGEKSRRNGCCNYDWRYADQSIIDAVYAIIAPKESTDGTQTAKPA
jgi:hypothetical protein